jgi:[ribosomal protein S5]-alanine N-acetyltransferase
MNFILETDRCQLREFDPSDALPVYHLNLHPDIYRFTTDPPFESEAHALQFLKSYDAYTRNGFGRWAVILKETSSFIGWCGLKYIHEENETDVGYRFLPEYWGQGFAVETAKACISQGFEYGLTRIVARVHKENVRSIRVSEKLGMIYEKDLLYDDVPWMNFVAQKKHFNS